MLILKSANVHVSDKVEVSTMMLIDVLFALTVSSVLTALIANHLPVRRAGEIFIGSFVLLFLLAGGAIGRALPPVVAGGTAWNSYLMIAVFGAILVISIMLAASSPKTFAWAPAKRGNVRHDAEAVAFDVVVWFLLLVFGIVALARVTF